LINQNNVSIQDFIDCYRDINAARQPQNIIVRIAMARIAPAPKKWKSTAAPGDSRLPQEDGLS